MLKYLLVKNATTTGTDKCVALVSSPENKTCEDVISRMVTEGSGLTRPQAMAYFERLTQIIAEFVSEGYSIKTPLIRIRPTIRGVFDGKTDFFDSSRHQINISITAGSHLRETVSKIKLEKTSVPQKMLAVSSFSDAASGSINRTATPGGIGTLKGNCMTFDVNDTQQGIFFVPVSNPGNEVRVTLYAVIKPSEVHFQIPALNTGEYCITVKASPKTGKQIRAASIGTTVLV